MAQFTLGMIAMGFAIAGLFFLRFWKETRDRLFGIFALAFFVFSLNRIALALTGQQSEVATSLYIVRLLGFVLILVAIIDKNRSTSSSSAPEHPPRKQS